MERFIGILTALFFPQSCLSCGKRGSALCSFCALSIPLAGAHRNENTYAIYEYKNNIVAKVIRDLKYHRKSEAAVALMRRGTPYISEWLSDALQSEMPEYFIVVPIPQHTRKTQSRGYNQSTFLARIIAKELKDARVALLLSKIRFTLPQSHTKSRIARLSNVKDSMVARGVLDSKIVYILIDDVTTTGATFIEATRALKIAGAQKILCVALAHGQAKK